MGSGSGSTTTTGPTINQTSSAPWSPQQGYLTSAFGSAQNNYNAQSSTPYTGSYAAGPTSQQYNAYGNAYDSSLLNQGAVNDQLVLGDSQAQTGANNTQGTINDLGYFGAANNASNLGSTASQIASGFNVPAEVQAATNEAQLQANQTSIPNLYRSAAAGGDINGSQAALEQGVIQQGLSTNAQNLAASLYNQNYGTGLSTGQNMNAQNLTALQAAGLLGTGQTNSGINAVNSGFTNQTANNVQEAAGANGTQNLNQLTNTSNLANYTGPQSLQNQQLAQLMAIIGGNYGSQGTSIGTGSTSNTTTNPSLLSTLGAGTGVIGSLIGNGTTTNSNGTTTTNNGLIGSLSNLGSYI